MFEKIRALIEKHWDMVSYLFFGVLTTVVNYLVYLPLYNLLGISAAVSNIIAWVAAVAFAYVTNKPFVFKSHDWSMKTVFGGLLGLPPQERGLATATATAMLRNKGVFWHRVHDVVAARQALTVALALEAS